MSGEEFRTYSRDELLGELFPDPGDRIEIAAGMGRLRAEQRAFRLAEMRRRLGFSQKQITARRASPRAGHRRSRSQAWRYRTADHRRLRRGPRRTAGDHRRSCAALVCRALAVSVVVAALIGIGPSTGVEHGDRVKVVPPVGHFAVLDCDDGDEAVVVRPACQH